MGGGALFDFIVSQSQNLTDLFNFQLNLELQGGLWWWPVLISFSAKVQTLQIQN